MIHTLTPDLRAYLLASLVLIAAACLPLAAHIRTRWLEAFGIGFMPAYAAIMTVVVLGGVLLLGPDGIVVGPALGLAAAIPAGVCGGLVVIVADGWIVRSFAGVRRRGPKRGRQRVGRSAGVQRVRPVALGPSSTESMTGTRRPLGVRRTKGDFTPKIEDYQVSLGWLLAVAFLEELVFRGVLVRSLALAPRLLGGQIATQLSGLGCITVLFVLCHVFFGWEQVVAKVPLAVLAMALTVATGSVYTAVITHGTFNFYVWRYQNTVVRAVTS